MMDGGDDGFDDVDDALLTSISLDFPEHSTALPPDGGDGDSGIDPIDGDGSPPATFPFPFQPYKIQEAFMDSLYRTLDQGKLGIFESPTGTGKSLSLICGALTWLRDHENRRQMELKRILEAEKNGQCLLNRREEKTTSDLDWIAEFARKQQITEEAVKLKEEAEQALKREARLNQLRSNQTRTNKRKRDPLEEKFEALFPNASLDVGESELDEEEDPLLVAEYNSDEEKEEVTEEEEEHHVTKIFYCSRTHSQLAQFVHEVQQSPFGEITRVVTLGSRQNLCVNNAVRRLRSLNLINDRCLELKKKGCDKSKKTGDTPKRPRVAGGGGCPFYKQEAMLDFRDQTMLEIRDIEQLVTLGRQTKACPYYGTRQAIPAAQLVVLPYNCLLHKNTRESSGLKLTGNIVIIDEAHNLLESISNIHSVSITGQQLLCAHSQLSQYMERYRSRLKAKNLMYIKQLLFLLSAFIKRLGGRTDVASDAQTLTKTETRLQTINDFLFDCHLDNFNLFKVLRYCQRSMISKKLHGFVEKFQPPVVNIASKPEEVTNWALSNFLKEISQGNKKTSEPENVEPVQREKEATPGSPLMLIESLLEALTNSDKDGRIVINKQNLLSQSCLRFLLLNPAVYFRSVLQEARSVILAGGTMQPLSEFKDQLFYAAGVEHSRITDFSCGHVIPPENILPVALARGSSGLELDFTYQKRNLSLMMDELGRVVYNVCNVVPGGVVVFFPSYEFERTVFDHWEKAGFHDKITTKKKIFREPKSASLVESTLSDYGLHIKRHLNNKYSSQTGAILFCVVGGKVSEGINFSDDLARCIMMVGLPYPNVNSPELKEKMDYLNANLRPAPDGRLPGQIHYENLCMKAVNQSIGRAVRHKDDYAAILLLDHRYLRPAMRGKLPLWIAEHLRRLDRFGPAIAQLKAFFADKRGASEK